MINVVQILETNPKQQTSKKPTCFRGWTDKRECIVVSFRWGILTIRLGSDIGKEISFPEGREVFYAEIGEENDNVMHYPRLCAITQAVIHWPLFANEPSTFSSDIKPLDYSPGKIFHQEYGQEWPTPAKEETTSAKEN